jgi:hypothetical protein
MHATAPIDATIAPEVKEHVRKLEELWTMLESPPEGVDVAANVAAYVAESGEDVAIAIAIYCKTLEGALAVGRAERARILEAVQGNERERDWLRGKLGEIMDRLGVKKIRGSSITVTRTAAGSKSARLLAGADVDMLPERFLAPREPSKGAIRDALLAGEVVPGWELVEAPGVMIR